MHLGGELDCLCSQLPRMGQEDKMEAYRAMESLKAQLEVVEEKIIHRTDMVWSGGGWWMLAMDNGARKMANGTGSQTTAQGSWRWGPNCAS